MKTNERITCKDGFSVSVQASAFTYCLPRDNNGPYEEVELGFPSEADALITPYSESDDLTGTVYPYVDVEVVKALINKHGGVVSGDLPIIEGGWTWYGKAEDSTEDAVVKEIDTMITNIVKLRGFSDDQFESERAVQRTVLTEVDIEFNTFVCKIAERLRIDKYTVSEIGNKYLEGY